MKLDIENATDLVAKFGVKSIPFLIFEKDGVERAKAGVMSVSELRGFCNL
jgi:thioredoxin-like negative regulator of GroEL